MKKCVHCGQELRFHPVRGWVHPEGGTYMVECQCCGWLGASYPSPIVCPYCGSDRVYDHHAARPAEEG